MERQLNFVNNLNNRVRKRYYIDDNSEFDLVPQEENNQVYSINDNQLFQMEVANEEEEISGNMVSFMGRQKTKIEKLQANIQPVQNLNGYDNPWPAGGGKNKYNAEAVNSRANNGITITVNDGAITFNGTATATAYFTVVDSGLPSGNYSFSFNNPVANDGLHVSFRDSDNVYFNDTKADAVNKTAVIQNREPKSITFYVASGTTLTNFVVKPQIESGSTATPWTPYSNICPISGWTGANVTRTGKNLSKLSNNTTGDGQRCSITYLDSGATVNATGTYARQGWLFPVKKGQTYTIRFTGVASIVGAGYNNKIYIGSKDQAWSGSNDGFITYKQITTKEASYSQTFTAATDLVFFGVYVSATATEGSITVSNVQLELGSTATAYEPYNGNTYTIQLGETVYGGTLDVVNGKMTVDRAMVDMGTLTWNRMSTNASEIYRFGVTLSGITTQDSGDDIPNMLCSVYEATSPNATYLRIKTGITNNIGGSHRVIVYDPAFELATAEDFKAAMSGVFLVYELATPITLTLTPEQISTLQGVNNVWSDVGTITLKYSTKGLTTYLLKP